MKNVQDAMRIFVSLLNCKIQFLLISQIDGIEKEWNPTRMWAAAGVRLFAR